MPRKTDTRQRMLQWIEEFRGEKGYSPTIAEIKTAMGLAQGTVQYHVRVLAKEGHITKEDKKFRAIATSTDTALSVKVPHLGEICAGRGIPVLDDTALDAAEKIYIPMQISKGRKNLYAVRVVGNSMLDALIAPGDIVILELVNGASVSNGDVVAVWLKKQQEATLKEIHFENHKVRLQPCNPFMDAVWLDADDIEIQGRLVGVMRSYIK